METIRSRAPIVNTSTETFHEHVTVGGERRVMDFKKEVTWLRESESQLQILHGGALLVEGGCYNDFYGLMTSMSDPMREAENAMKRYQVGPDSTLEIRVVCTVRERPALVSEETARLDAKEGGQRKHYSHVPDAWRLKVAENGETRWPLLESVEVAKGTVWSNKMSPSENVDALDAFVKKWAVEPEPALA